MSKIISIVIVLSSVFCEAASRPELLALCSSQAKQVLKSNYFGAHAAATKAGVEFLGLTTWLSAENSVPPHRFKFTHIAKVKRANKLMHWDFHSITEVSGASCKLIYQIKTGERYLAPPEDCGSCDDNQD